MTFFGRKKFRATEQGCHSVLGRTQHGNKLCRNQCWFSLWRLRSAVPGGGTKLRGLPHQYKLWCRMDSPAPFCLSGQRTGVGRKKQFLIMGAAGMRFQRHSVCSNQHFFLSTRPYFAPGFEFSAISGFFPIALLLLGVCSPNIFWHPHLEAVGVELALELGFKESSPTLLCSS